MAETDNPQIIPELPQDSPKLHNERRLWRRQFVAVAVFILVAGFFASNYRMVVVRGASMLPTYQDGQVLLAMKHITWGGPLKTGDVVVIRTPGDTIIKRIAYLPGETIEYPNSMMFRRVWDYFEVTREGNRGDNFAPVSLKVPPGYVVVLGDNRAVSEDSRVMGPIAVKDLLGRISNARPRP